MAHEDSVKEKPIVDVEHEILEQLRQINQVLTMDSQREMDFQRRSLYTAKEIVKIDATTTTNVPQGKGTGWFTEPMRLITVDVVSVTGGATTFINVGAVPDRTNAVELAVGDSFTFREIPTREVYAFTDTGTAHVQAVGYR